MPPTLLYKYQPATARAVANVVKSGLWFAAPVTFNDPFDCALTIHKRQLDDDDLKPAFARQVKVRGKAQLLAQFGPDEHKNPHFRRAMETAIDKAFADQRHDHSTNRGVSCFAERHDNLLMWAHYGVGHTGFCLQFDASGEPFSKAERVVYTDQVPALNPLDLFEVPPPNGRRFTTAMLLTKSSCWQYEEEWRLTHIAGNTMIGYPPAALTAIYVGSNATGPDIDALLQLGRSRGLPAFRMVRSDTDFTLRQVPVK